VALAVLRGRLAAPGVQLLQSEARSMSKWTVEAHLYGMDMDPRVITLDGAEDSEMVLKLAQVEARFVLDGFQFVGGKPTVDLVNRKLVYRCEGWKL
jgi:hypothetical protein